MVARLWRKSAAVALLLAALVGGGLVVFTPHHNWITGGDQPFAVHADEYFHWVRMEQIQEDQGFLEAEGFHASTSLHEHGFWLYVASFQQVTGIDWTLVFLYGPVAVYVLLALAAYALAEREVPGAGPFAAAFVGLVPTTLRFLGPGFFVPIAFALPLVLVMTWVMLHLRGPARIALALVLASTLWTIHAMAGLVACLLALGYAAAIAVRDWRAALAVGVAGAGPALAVYDFYARSLGNLDASGVGTFGADAHVLRLVPWTVYALAIAGLVILVARRDAGVRARGFSILAAVLALGGIILLMIDKGVDLGRAYDRAHMPFFVLVCLSAGIGLGWVVSRLPLLPQKVGLKLPRIAVHGTSAAILALAVVISGSALVNGARAQSKENFLLELTPQLYDDFVWVRQNVPREYTTGVMPDTRGLAFAAVTERHVAFPTIPSEIQSPKPEVNAFYASHGSDTAFLLRHRISIVYSTQPLDNPDLEQVHPHVYLLREDYVQKFAPS